MPTGRHRCGKHGKRGDTKVGTAHCEVCKADRLVAVIDPVTNKPLSLDWKHPDTLPPPPDRSEDTVKSYLVLLGQRPKDLPWRDISARLCVMRVNCNGVQTMGGAMSFDLPPFVAWQPLPKFFL